MTTPEPARPLRVLNVEDSEDDALLLRRHLRRASYELLLTRVDTAETLRAALDTEEWDLCLVDYNLPHLSAPAVLELLRGRGLDLPVIVLSGMISEEAAVDLMHAGARDFVRKDNLARLVPAVERELREAEHRRERRRAEESLRQSEQLLRKVLEVLPVGVWITDERGRIVQSNEAGRRIWGGAQYVGVERYDEYKGWWLATGEPIGPEEWAAARAVRKGETSLEEEVEIEAFDGTRKIILNSAIPLRGGRGEVVGAIVVNQNVTERKRAEREREELFAREQAARRRAEEANRLKDEFLATVSHELRTPLTAIIGWAHLLKNAPIDTDTARHAVGVIGRNAEQQRQIIEDILDVSRVVAGKLRLELEEVDVASMVRAALDTIRPAAEAKGLHLLPTLAPGVAVIGDPHRLQQVVWNLLTNAVKFTPEGGVVRVSVEPRLTHARVEVSDTGQGIAPEFLPYVFDRFRQQDGSTTRAHGGLGLGLAIVRHLVEAHGGSVHAYSAGEGQGATFTVDLPLPLEAVSSLQQSAASAEGVTAEELTDILGPDGEAEGGPPSLVGLRLLVVDDDEDTLEMLTAFLRRGGAELTTASSAAAALAALGTARPDVIVADIGMPEIDGYELLRRVRALTPEEGGRTPAVALTAYAGEADRVRALRSGFQAHLAKPVEPRALVSEIIKLAGTSLRREH